ncbi:MAG TPA: SDR family oxidoreductase [Jatrophihabitantaceae bacterium]|jgi:3alpha(or 20beta)-hydroxysteroid dehydrogenase
MKVVLVTGGAGGIGAALGNYLLAQGWAVVSGDLRPGNLTGVLDLPLDVRDEQSWQAVTEEIISRFGRLDGLVNNAGVLGRADVLTLSPEVFDETTAVNMRGCYLGMRTAGAVMGEGGSIVNISSVAALGGAGDLLAYCATKWAIRGMTKVAAISLGPHGIRVNAVLPGIVATGMSTDDDDPERTAFVRGFPLGRKATPDEVCAAISFLLGDGSSYVTGTEIVVDGGLSAAVPMPPRH